MIQSKDKSKTDIPIKERLVKLWDRLKANVQADEKDGEYIVIDDHELIKSGFSSGDLKSPGNFRTFNSGGRNYFLKSFSEGRYKLFRK